MKISLESLVILGAVFFIIFVFESLRGSWQYYFGSIGILILLYWINKLAGNPFFMKESKKIHEGEKP